MAVMKLLGSVLGVSVLALGVGCAGHDDGKEGKVPPTGPEVATAPPEDPKPESAAASVQVAVASVQLQDDCPSPKKAQAEDEPMQPKSEKPSMAMPDEPMGDVADSERGFAPMCVQSRVQLSIESEVDAAVGFAIREVRLKQADGGKVVGTMGAREPKIWDESKYSTWDESIPANVSVKVGYALGDPGWSRVEKALGSSSWGPLFVVEIDVEIDGEVRTIVSPKVPRDEPENIVT